MSSASRRVLITCWSVSLSLLTTRSWSPWIRTCSLLETFWIRLRKSRASSSLMPALSRTSIWPRPLPTVFGSPAWKSFGESCRRAAFSRSTWRAALARSSLTGPRDQLLASRLDAGRPGVALQVGDRLLEVVTRSPQLGDDHVQRRGAGGGRVLAPEVGDDAVHAHVAIHNRFSSPHAGEGDPSRSERPDGGFRRAIHFIQWVWKPKPRPR